MRALKFAVPLGWTEILKRTSKEILAGNCFGWAASLAYYFFLALFPALLFVVSLASVLPVQHLIDRIVAMLSRVAPGDVVAIAQRQFVQITRQPHGGVLTLGLVAALWSTSSGMTAIVDTLNQAYHITESRPWWRVRVTAIALTLALTIVTLIAFALVMVGPTIAQQAADWLTLGPLFRWTWNIVRWPAAFALVVTAIGCIYHFAPDTRHEWVWITPGSVMATVIWLLISLAFKWYVSHFAGYQKTYGAIGGVMVALLWFYFTSLAILLGAQLDATIEHASPSAPRCGAAGAVNPALHPVGHWPTGTR
jgi:membrane protein